MIEKLEEVEQKFHRLTADLTNPDVLADSARLQKTAKERASLEKLGEASQILTEVILYQPSSGAPGGSPGGGKAGAGETPGSGSAAA